MGAWKLHWLDATGDLSPWQDRITAEVEAACVAMAPFVTLPKLDVLVERGADSVRPDIGMSAHVPRPNLATLIFDPYHENFRTMMGSGLIRRQMVNTAHRALRAAGPGYGFTLSGALVSEGLAAQFTRLVCTSPPEPWEQASDAILAAHWPDARGMMTTKFDFSEWFLGNGNKPFGLGYALGARIVEHWMLSGVALDAERLISVPTPKVLAASPQRALAG